jgi:hypothetical protein
MTRLVIHLGDCKAGSTSIQQTLDAGTWRAEGGAALAYARAGHLGFNHHPLANSLNKKAWARHREHLYDSLAEEVAAAPAEVLVVSSEHFEFTDPALLRETLERHLPGALPELRLISYLRPHPERILSSFAQRTKNGLFRGALEQFHTRRLRRGVHLYAPRIARWQEVFGDRLTVRPLIRGALREGCAVRDFLGWATGADSVALTAEAEANGTLSQQDLALMRDFWARATARGELRPLSRTLITVLESRPDPAHNRLRLHRALAERIRADYAEDAARLDAEVFGAPMMVPALDAAVEKAVAAPQSLEAEAVVEPQALRMARLWQEAVAQPGILAPPAPPPAQRLDAARADAPGADEPGPDGVGPDGAGTPAPPAAAGQAS